MDNVEELFSQLSRLPGFRRENFVNVWNYLVKQEHIGNLSPWQQMAQLEKNLIKSTQENTRKMISFPSIMELTEEQVVPEAAEEEPLRQVVLSHLTAVQAAKDQPVKDFRHNILGKQLLMWRLVQSWILIQALQDGQPPTLWLQDIPVPSEYTENLKEKLIAGKELAINISPQQIVDTAQIRYLKFGISGFFTVRKVAITKGGVLERLWNLSNFLAEKYPWTEAQATIFVLTGLSPLIPAITHQLHLRSLASHSRISLDIDSTYPPNEVAKFYSRHRHEIAGLNPRELSEKHLKLALFVALLPQSKKWSEKMAEWNKAFPQWRYRRETSFGSDAIIAQRRVLNPDYRRATGLLKSRGEEESSQGDTSEWEDENG